MHIYDFWYPWYPALHKDKSIKLNLEQDAIFRRLIDHYMMSREPLLNDSQAIANICMIPLEKWESNSKKILTFFKEKDGYLYNKRCDTELDRQDNRSRKMSENAKKAKLKRKQNQEEVSNCLAEAAIQDKTRQDKIEERKEERDAKPKRARTKKPVTFISEEFRGDIKSISIAGSLNLDFEREQRKFIDHYLAKGEARADWQASFRTWLGRAAEYGAERTARAASGRQEVRDVTGAALRVIAARNKTYN